MESLAALTERALNEVVATDDLAQLDEVRVRWLGKKGLLTEQLKALGNLPAAERPAAGQLINVAKARVQEVLDPRLASLQAAASALPGALPLSHSPLLTAALG